MTAFDTDRDFSEKKHRSGDWQTHPVTRTGAASEKFRRMFSFKLTELYRFAKQCRNGDMVLDYGCGTGVYSRYAASHAPIGVVAVDWSITALEKLVSAGDDSVIPVCADLLHLPFKTGSFDGLYSIDVLGHLREQEQALDEVVRICRAHAPLFIHSECADYRSRWPDRKIIERTGVDLIAEIDGHIGIRRAEEMYALFRRHFIVRHVYSPAGITGWLTGYPEKYAKIFLRSGMWVSFTVAFCASVVKRAPVAGWLIRGANNIVNRLELLLYSGAGGSCFMRGETRSPPRLTGEGSCGDAGMDVVVATYNRSGVLFDEVVALLRQCREHDRIIVVWQGYEMPSLPENECVRVLHVAKPSLTNARNCGWRSGENPIVVFVDDDCSIGDGFLEKYRRLFATGATNGAVGFIDDPLFPEKRSVYPSRFDVKTGAIYQQFDCGEDGATISVMGANMAFTRDALEETGGFDCGYQRNAVWEDVDISFRMLRQGLTLQYCSGARVQHLRLAEGGCRQDHGAAYLFHLFSNTAYFACTWTAVRNAAGWARYWLYHLEYLARTAEHHPRCRWHRYNVVSVAAGLSGSLWGVGRFLLSGKRKKMPDMVVAQSREHFGGKS